MVTEPSRSTEPPQSVDVARMRLDGDVTGLCRTVRSGDSRSAGHAAELLADLGGPQAAEVLLHSLETRDDDRPWLCLDAARSLGRMRERRAVPALVRLLEGGHLRNAGQEETVLRALGSIGGPEAVRVLLDRLAEQAPRDGVLAALAELRDPQTVPALLVALWGLLPVRGVEAVRVIGALRDPRTAPALLFLARSEGSSPRLRRAALAGLAGLPDGPWPAPSHMRTEAMLLPALRGPDPETARLAARLLARTDGGRSDLRGVLLRHGFAAAAPASAVLVVCELVQERPGLFGDPGDWAYAEGSRALVRLLDRSPLPVVRRAAAGALGALGDDAAVAALLAALDDDRITDAVAAAVARLATPPVQRLLALLADDAGTARCRGAARALGLIGCEAAAPLLLRALEPSGPPALRTAAADALGDLRHRPAAERLAALVADEGEPGRIRARAVRALGAIGAPESLPVLLAATQDPAEAVRHRGAEALRNFPVHAAARRLLALTVHDESRDVVLAAVRSLGRIGTPAVPALTALADQARAWALPALVQALAGCPGPEAAAALGRLATSAVPEQAGLAAAEALSNRREPECIAPLAQLLADPRRDRWHPAALRGLARIGGEEAAGHVAAYYNDRTTCRGEARAALGLIAAARAAPPRPGG